MMGPFWMVLWLLLLYQFARALEQEWGDFRFCLFYVIGAIATIVTALTVNRPLSNVPLNTTLFLAFATLFPNFELLLFFILPVKVKYLAALTWFWMAAAFLMGSSASRASIVASLANYGIFFGPQIWESAKLRWEVYKNRRRFR
jgi:membrane associated rhomboid family serine protease